MFLRSLRLAEFGTYVYAVYKMLPWYFALKHTDLGEKVPGVAEAFKQGLFTIAKTDARFSAIAIDQAHEQNNAMVKGEGGAVGLTENPCALRRWLGL